MNTKTRHSLIAALLIFAASHLQASAHPWTGEELVVVELERSYFDALRNRDQDAMLSLLHENFIISSLNRPAAPSLDRAAFLETMPGQVIAEQDITHVKVDIMDNVAKSVVNISMVKTYNGKDHSGDYEVYSVWVRDDGRWKLLDRRIKFLNPAN